METLEAPTDELVDEREAARMMCVSPGTLSVWRSTKRYPLPYVRIGHCVRYSRKAVLKFIADGAVTPVRLPDPKPKAEGAATKRHGRPRKANRKGK